jgi:type I restriction enzyme, S subunit
MKRAVIEYSEDTVSELAMRETGLRLLPPSVVLIVVRGMILAHSFPVAVTTVPVTVNQDMKALIVPSSVDSSFAALYLRGVGRAVLAELVEDAAHGTKAIRMDRWRQFPIVVLPRNEQQRIVVSVERKVAKIAELLTAIRNGIERLHERRSALISAAVTGKIDVQDHVRQD